MASLFLTSSAFPQIIYVDANATALIRDGSTWCESYLHLQDALAAVEAAGAAINEIRVVNGTYKPDQGAAQIPGDRDATFHLLSNVTLSGRFAGCGAPVPHERNIAAYETILSGDLAGDDAKVPLDELHTEPTRAENSIHVVSSIDADLTFFSGFTVRGGGLYISGSSANMTSCAFTENKATDALERCWMKSSLETGPCVDRHDSVPSPDTHVRHGLTSS